MLIQVVPGEEIQAEGWIWVKYWSLVPGHQNSWLPPDERSQIYTVNIGELAAPLGYPEPIQIEGCRSLCYVFKEL